eukprot:tig00021517_g22016.t1
MRGRDSRSWRGVIIRCCIIALSFLPFFALLRISGPLDEQEAFTRMTRRKGGVEATLADCLPHLAPPLPRDVEWSERLFRMISEYACCGSSGASMPELAPPPAPVSYDPLPPDARKLLEAEKCFVRPKLGPKVDLCVYEAAHDNMISKSIVQTGVWDIDTMRFLQFALEDEAPGIVIDVGANIGLFTLSAAAMGHTVFAFEPFSENVARLAAGVVRNRLQGRVRLYPAALSDSRFAAEIAVEGTNRGGGTIRRKPTLLREDIGEARPLDDWLGAVEAELGVAVGGPAPSLLLLKLDAEGHEPRVLAGAARLLAAQRPKFVVLEVSPALMGAAGCSFRRVVEVLLREGAYCAFEGAALDPSARLEAGNATGVEEWAERAARLHTDDLFFVRRGSGIATCP